MLRWCLAQDAAGLDPHRVERGAKAAGVEMLASLYYQPLWIFTRRGESIEMPTYDFAADNRSSKTVTVQPAPVIVIEGLFALFDPELRKMMSLKIFVDTAADVRFIRRLQRDITERGRSTESVVQQYLDTVRPMHKQFIEPTKRNADVILPHGANGPAVDIITTKVKSLLQDFERA